MASMVSSGRALLRKARLPIADAVLGRGRTTRVLQSFCANFCAEYRGVVVSRKGLPDRSAGRSGRSDQAADQESTLLIRLGWHDAGTYDKNISEWPKCGGANGSLRFSIELSHGANAADLLYTYTNQMAGGPTIPMRYGRVDTSSPEECPKEGNLPDAGPANPSEHLRKVFYRMGLDDKEIVALSGAHTLGRSRPSRSGWGKPETKYTKDGPGAPGGQSWTVEWLKFDNSYFKDIKERKDEDLLVLPTDAVLFDDPGFKKHAELYARDQDAFFKDYAQAHAKLSELGAKFDPPQGIRIAS